MIPCGFSLLFLQLRFSSRAAWRKDASTGAIRGTVLDPSGKSISGATVALVNDATGLHYEQASDQAGRFAFELLAPGEYSARVAADKMSPQISPNIRVEIGGVAEINFSLLIAGARESVTVSAEPQFCRVRRASIARTSLKRSATKASVIPGNSAGTRY